MATARVYSTGNQAGTSKEVDNLFPAKTPYPPAILRRLRLFWEAEKHIPDHIMRWAACCMCFFGFLRSGEFTVPSAKEYDPGGHLSEGDVTLDNVLAPTLASYPGRSLKKTAWQLNQVQTVDFRCPGVGITNQISEHFT